MKTKKRSNIHKKWRRWNAAYLKVVTEAILMQIILAVHTFTVSVVVVERCGIPQGTVYFPRDVFICEVCLFTSRVEKETGPT